MKLEFLVTADITTHISKLLRAAEMTNTRQYQDIKEQKNKI